MAEEDIVKIARQILVQEIDPIEGIRLIVGQKETLSALNKENSALVVLIAVDSETDHFPAEKTRHLWDQQALKKQDIERTEYLEQYKSQIFEACNKIIKDFS